MSTENKTKVINSFYLDHNISAKDNEQHSSVASPGFELVT